MEDTLKLILNQLESINGRLDKLEQGQNELKNDVNELKETTSRIESKQTMIYEQTGNLLEFQSHVKDELKDIKYDIRHNNHKMADIESDLFRIKVEK